jgi:hypothetical protein
VRDIERTRAELAPLVVGHGVCLRKGGEQIEQARTLVAETGHRAELLASMVEQLHDLPPQDFRDAAVPKRQRRRA